MDPVNVTAWATAGAAFVAVIAIAAQGFLIVGQTRTSIRNQRSVTILHCNERYDALYELRVRIEEASAPTEAEIRGYFRRFWGLKSDQLDYWLAGYVDPDTFASWMISTVELLRDDSKKIGGLTYLKGWQDERASHRYVNQDLYDLVEMFSEVASHYSDYKDRYSCVVNLLRELEEDERAYINNISGWGFHRYTVPKLIRTLRNDLSSGIDTNKPHMTVLFNRLRQP